jgi:hypothetical protein
VRLFAVTPCLGKDNLIFDDSELIRSEAITKRGFLVPIPEYACPDKDESLVHAKDDAIVEPIISEIRAVRRMIFA